MTLLQKLSGAGDRAARAHAGHHDVETSAGLPPDLRASAVVVRVRVGRVGVLVGVEAVGCFFGDAAADVVVTARILGGHRGGSDDHARAEGPQQANLLFGHLIRRAGRARRTRRDAGDFTFRATLLPRPPAIAGMIDTSSPSWTGVESPSSWRISVPLTKMLMKLRTSPVSSHSCWRIPGYVRSKASSRARMLRPAASTLLWPPVVRRNGVGMYTVVMALLPRTASTWST